MAAEQSVATRRPTDRCTQHEACGRNKNTDCLLLTSKHHHCYYSIHEFALLLDRFPVKSWIVHCTKGLLLLPSCWSSSCSTVFPDDAVINKQQTRPLVVIDSCCDCRSVWCVVTLPADVFPEHEQCPPRTLFRPHIFCCQYTAFFL